MQCSDLERYLEAYLDLRLGRSRGAILRRHLSGCPACRSRVEHLRQFERDLQHSFRAMERAQSVWTGLEPDLVRTGGLAEPPPLLPFFGTVEAPRNPIRAVGEAGVRPSRAVRPDVSAARARARRLVLRHWAQRVAGIMVIALSVGAVVPIWRAWFGPLPAPPAVGAASDMQTGVAAIQIATDSAEVLHRWLARRLGDGLPALPLPAGFQLVGGGIEDGTSPARGFVVYRQDMQSTLLRMAPLRPGAEVSTTPSASRADGMNRLSWNRAGFAYSVESPLPETELLSFAAMEPSPL